MSSVLPRRTHLSSAREFVVAEHFDARQREDQQIAARRDVEIGERRVTLAKGAHVARRNAAATRTAPRSHCRAVRRWWGARYRRRDRATARAAATVRRTRPSAPSASKNVMPRSRISVARRQSRELAEQLARRPTASLDGGSSGGGCARVTHLLRGAWRPAPAPRDPRRLESRAARDSAGRSGLPPPAAVARATAPRPTT